MRDLLKKKWRTWRLSVQMSFEWMGFGFHFWDHINGGKFQLKDSWGLAFLFGPFHFDIGQNDITMWRWVPNLGNPPWYRSMKRVGFYFKGENKVEVESQWKWFHWDIAWYLGKWSENGWRTRWIAIGPYWRRWSEKKPPAIVEKEQEDREFNEWVRSWENAPIT